MDGSKSLLKQKRERETRTWIVEWAKLCPGISSIAEAFRFVMDIYLLKGTL